MAKADDERAALERKLKNLTKPEHKGLRAVVEAKLKALKPTTKKWDYK